MHRIARAPVRLHPFPHFCVKNVFPEDFYQEILGHLPPLEVYRPIAEGGRVFDHTGTATPELYKERFVILMKANALDRFDPAHRAFWGDLLSWFKSERFLSTALGIFGPHVQRRFENSAEPPLLRADVQLVRDFTNYSLGPHTDDPKKVVVVLFYLAASADYPHLGTSIYVPKDPEFRCVGGPHYPYDKFERVATMAYAPNSVVGFLKTSNSFHGVEPVKDENVCRDLIQLSIVQRGRPTGGR